MEQNILDEPVRAVETRFELAAWRMVERWVTAGSISVSAGDIRMAREFLEHAGFRVEDIEGLRIRLVTRDGHIEELTREAAVLLALRRLAARVEASNKTV